MLAGGSQTAIGKEDMTTTIAADSSNQAYVTVTSDTGRLSLVERGLLFVGINEIMLQFDKSVMFHERDADLGAVAGFVVSPMGIALAILYWIWFSNAVGRRDRAFHSRVVWCTPMLVYLVAVGLSVFSAPVPMLSFNELFLIGQGYLLFFYLANRIKHRNDIVFLVGCLASALLVQAVVNFGLKALGPSAYGKFFQIGPIRLEVWEEGRVAGTMHSAVLAGSTMAMIWLPTAALGLCKDVPKGWKTLAAVATIAGALGILFTQTRGAILTVLIGSTIIFAGLHYRRWLPKWAVPMALFVCLVSILPLIRVIQGRIVEGDGGSAESRIHLSAIGLEAISHRPLSGYGAGNCHIACEEFATQAKYRSLWYYTVHCKYLVVWIETGLLGLLSYLAILLSGLRFGWSAWRVRDPLLSPLGLALSASIVGTMVHMSVDIFNSRIQTHLFWAILGITAAVWKLSQSAAERGKTDVSYGS